MGKYTVIYRDPDYLAIGVLQSAEQAARNANEAANQAASDASEALSTAGEAKDEAEQAKLPPYVPFDSRSQAEGAAIPGDVQYINVADLQYARDPDGTALETASGVKWSPLGDPTPQHFGAVGDGETDDSDAFDAFLAYVESKRVGRGEVFDVPPERYLLTRPLVIKRTSNGPGVLRMGGATLVCAFNRQQYAAFIVLGDPDTPGSSQAPLETQGIFWIEGHSSVTGNVPIGIRCHVQAQSVIDGLRTRNWGGNKVLDLKRVQNITIPNSILYGGGYSFGYRDTEGSQFRRNGTTLTRTVGAFEFQASDVGKQVSLFLTDYTITGIIQSVTDSANVVMNAEFASVDGTDRNMRFGSPAPSTTSGSPVVGLDGPVNAQMVGLDIGIPRAGADGQTLWSTITSVDTGANTITLNKTALATLDPVANPLTETSEIAGVQIMIDSEPDVSSTRISQVRILQSQSETYRGVAIGVNDAEFVDIIVSKFHGISQSYMNWQTYALATIWGNRLSGRMIGDLDQVTLGQYKIRLADQTQTFTAIDVAARMRHGEKLARLESQAAGFDGAGLQFISYMALNVAPNIEFSDLVDDMTPGARGIIPPLQFVLPQYDSARFYLGPNVRGDRAGNLTFKTPDTWFAPDVGTTAGAGTATGTFTGTYSRTGDLITASYRLLNIDTAGLTGTNFLRASLPVSAMSNGNRNVHTAPCYFEGIAGNGYILARVNDNAQNVTFWRPNGSGGLEQLQISALTSGTASLQFSISYVAA